MRDAVSTLNKTFMLELRGEMAKTGLMVASRDGSDKHRSEMRNISDELASSCQAAAASTARASLTLPTLFRHSGGVVKPQECRISGGRIPSPE